MEHELLLNEVYNVDMLVLIETWQNSESQICEHLSTDYVIFNVCRKKLSSAKKNWNFSPNKKMSG